MKALLLIDHGSRRVEANEMLDCMASLVQHMVGTTAIVRHAHMELAEPDIEAGFKACVQAGATEIVAFPYMLSPGRHATSDIPDLVREAASKYPNVRYTVTNAFGVDARLAEVILTRAGITATVAAESVGQQCWGSVAGCCGGACASPGASAYSNAAAASRETNLPSPESEALIPTSNA
jgi:sirohydrochlorin ferrochelatase